MILATNLSLITTPQILKRMNLQLIYQKTKKKKLLTTRTRTTTRARKSQLFGLAEMMLQKIKMSLLIVTVVEMIERKMIKAAAEEIAIGIGRRREIEIGSGLLLVGTETAIMAVVVTAVEIGEERVKNEDEILVVIVKLRIKRRKVVEGEEVAEIESVDDLLSAVVEREKKTLLRVAVVMAMAEVKENGVVLCDQESLSFARILS